MWVLMSFFMLPAQLSEVKNQDANDGLNILPITLEYTCFPRSVRWRALFATSKSNGLPTAMAPLSGQPAPSSPTYCRQKLAGGSQVSSNVVARPTFVKMFAPSEKPSANSGRFGKVALAHFTTCRTSHVALALNSTPLVTLLLAHPREFTTHTSQSPPSRTRGAMACRR